MEGKQTGGIPFGYESCIAKERDIVVGQCEPEHPGGVSEIASLHSGGEATGSHC